MENENLNGFVVHIYSPGNQIIQTQTNNYYGTVYQGKSESAQNGFSDEQVCKALQACVGKDQVINAKWKCAGAYWCLRWKCYYPVDPKEFCDKIKTLGIVFPDDLDCSYENIRKYCSLSFMDSDPFGKTEIRVSNMDKGTYSICRQIALNLGEELGKTTLLKG
jgi:hypothetical protein